MAFCCRIYIEIMCTQQLHAQLLAASACLGQLSSSEAESNSSSVSLGGALDHKHTNQSLFCTFLVGAPDSND